MVFKKILLLLFIILIYSSSIVWAVPPPCTSEELFENSSYAIEGIVLDTSCNGIRKVQSCSEKDTVTDCIARVKVTKSIKGNYSIGKIIEISYVNVIKRGEIEINGVVAHCTPGTRSESFEKNHKIKYYSVSENSHCLWWNKEDLGEVKCVTNYILDNSYEISDENKIPKTKDEHFIDTNGVEYSKSITRSPNGFELKKIVLISSDPTVVDVPSRSAYYSSEENIFWIFDVKEGDAMFGSWYGTFNGYPKDCENQGLCNVGEVKEYLCSNGSTIEECACDKYNLWNCIDSPKTKCLMDSDKCSKDSDCEDNNPCTQDICSEISKECSNRRTILGCSLGDNCLPIGTRINGEYCNINNSIKEQKNQSLFCNDNYECSSNICANGKCLEQTLIEKVINWLMNIFG